MKQHGNLAMIINAKNDYFSKKARFNNDPSSLTKTHARPWGTQNVFE
jgi:hypothetical protein